MTLKLNELFKYIARYRFMFDISAEFLFVLHY